MAVDSVSGSSSYSDDARSSIDGETPEERRRRLVREMDGPDGVLSSAGYSSYSHHDIPEPILSKRELIEGIVAKLDAMLSSLRTNPRKLQQPLPSLKLFIDPGSATVEDVRELLQSISELHVAAGGLGLTFAAEGDEQ